MLVWLLVGSLVFATVQQIALVWQARILREILQLYMQRDGGGRDDCQMYHLAPNDRDVESMIRAMVKRRQSNRPHPSDDNVDSHTVTPFKAVI